MKKWEYIIPELIMKPGPNEIDRRLKTRDTINEFGEEGWELVTAFENGIAIFKREKEK